MKVHSRKEMRKSKRRDAKAKKDAFFRKKKPNSDSTMNAVMEMDAQSNDVNKKIMDKMEKMQKKIKKNAKRKREDSAVKRRLMKDMKNDDKEIRKYEKKLKLNKRKKKGSLPMSFHDDGLGYIIDAVDGTMMYKDEHSDHDVYDYLRKKRDNNGDDANHSEQMLSEINDDDNDRDDDSNKWCENDEEIDNDVKDDDHVITEKKRNKKSKIWEDIYGRMRDEKGNVINDKIDDNKSDAKSLFIKSNDVNQQLVRNIRGALNRLTANNMSVISTQIEKLFKENSKYDVNNAFWNCSRTLLIDINQNAAVKLATELSILISILNAQIGDDIGGYAIHTLISQFNEMFQLTDVEMSNSKTFDNILLLLVNLYACGLIDSILIFDTINKLCEIFNEKSIELIMFILKSVGFILRKENPIQMKELILKVQSIASNIDKSALSGNRIGYMHDALMAIKNNNISKLSDYGYGVQKELIESTLKSVLKKSKVSSISGRYCDIIKGSRWWTKSHVHSAVDPQSMKSNDDFPNVNNININERLCKALRLNTSLRKTLFGALSTCHDYIDASQRMMMIGKKQFTEVITVILHVATHEHPYNSFYAHLCHHLSKCDRKYRVALDFAIRDKIVELQHLKPIHRTTLAELIFHLLKLNVLSITCLKVIEYSQMNEDSVQFLKHILNSILNEDDVFIERVFSKIPAKDTFAGAMRLFISCFIDNSIKHKVNHLRPF